MCVQGRGLDSVREMNIRIKEGEGTFKIINMKQGRKGQKIVKKGGENLVRVVVHLHDIIEGNLFTFRKGI